MDNINSKTFTTQRLNTTNKEHNNPNKPKSFKLFEAWNGTTTKINKARKMSLKRIKLFISRKTSKFKKRIKKLFNMDISVVINKDLKNKVKLFHKNYDEYNHLRRCSTIKETTSELTKYCMQDMQRKYARALEKKSKEDLNTNQSLTPKFIHRAISDRRVKNAKNNMDLQEKAYKKSLTEFSDSVARANVSLEVCNKSQNDMVEAFNIEIKNFKKIAKRTQTQITISKNKIIDAEKNISDYKDKFEEHKELRRQLTSKLNNEKKILKDYVRVLKNYEDNIKHLQDSLDHAEKHRK